jgi:hypothetical protein
MNSAHSDIHIDRSNDTFATCSVDKAIHVCQIGRDSPLRTFKGHSGDVNTIRWDPSGAILRFVVPISCAAFELSPCNRNPSCFLLRRLHCKNLVALFIEPRVRLERPRQRDIHVVLVSYWPTHSAPHEGAPASHCILRQHSESLGSSQWQRVAVHFCAQAARVFGGVFTLR